MSIKHKKTSVPSVKIGWVLTGDYSLASSRLQGYRIYDYLTKHGYDSHIICAEFGIYEKGYSAKFFSVIRQILKNKFDVIYFQKPGWMMFKMSEVLRLSGIKTIAIQCDPFPGDYEHYFDATITTSDELKRQLNTPSAYVIDDMLETPSDVFKQDYTQNSEQLKVAWVGQGVGAGGKKFILPFIQRLKVHPDIENKIDFVTISRGEWATHQWALDTVYSQLCDCDIAIIPLPEDSWATAKSTNRLTMLMALGIPTIASPVPSYLKVIDHGNNSLLANTEEEFINLIQLCFDQAMREKIGRAGRLFSLQHYSQDAIGPRWVETIHQTTNKGIDKPQSNITTKSIHFLAKLAAYL